MSHVWNRHLEEASTRDSEATAKHPHGAYTEYTVYSRWQMVHGGTGYSEWTYAMVEPMLSGTERKKRCAVYTRPTDRSTDGSQGKLFGGLPSRCFQTVCRVWSVAPESVCQATTCMLAGFTMSFMPA